MNGVDRLRQWSAPTQPTWTFIETTNIFGVGGPTAAQVKAEIWASLIHGSRGIVYFAHQISPNFDDAVLLHNPAMNAAVTGIDQQILSLAPCAEQPDDHRAIVHRQFGFVDSAGPHGEIGQAPRAVSVRVVVLRWHRHRHVHGSSAGAGSFADVLGESRTIPILNGTFADTFGPYAVHLYQVVPEPTAAGLLSFAIPAPMLRKRDKCAPPQIAMRQFNAGG